MTNYEKAIEKMDNEAEKNKGTHFRVIENYLRERIKGREDLAAKVVAKDKPLTGAYNAIYELAKAIKNRDGGSCVCVSPEDAWAAVDKFFGFNAEPAAPSAGGKVVSLFDML